MAKIRRIDLSPDEWIAGTMGMSLEEEGLYTRIIMRYYSRGEALPSDPIKLAKICNVRPQMIRRILPKLLHKFDETAGKLRQNRCETEIKLAENRLFSSRLNGAKGGRPKRIAEPGGSEPRAQPRRARASYHQLSTTNKNHAATQRVPQAGPASPGEEFLKKGEALLGKGKRSLVARMIQSHGSERVGNAFDAMERKHPDDPAAFFVACCRDPTEPQPPPRGYDGPKSPPPRPEDLWPREEPELCPSPRCC